MLLIWCQHPGLGCAGNEQPLLLFLFFLPIFKNFLFIFILFEGRERENSDLLTQALKTAGLKGLSHHLLLPWPRWQELDWK